MTRYFLNTFLLIITFAPSAFADVVDAGDLVWHAGVVEKPIAIESSSKQIRLLASKAFSTHGGYKIVDPAKAAFLFRIEPLSANSVSLTIESGTPLQMQFVKNMTGSSLNNATLKACDLAVQKTLGIAGYFAGKLSFIGEQKEGTGEVFVSDLFFQNVEQLTQDGAESVLPRWSPDGSKLLYTGYYLNGFPDIFLIDLKTGKRTPFATYRGTNTGGVFSPSGKYVAMILSTTGNPELFIADPQGKNPRRITRVKSLKASPSWSPDGERIVLTSDELGGPQLYQTSLKGDSWTRIPTNISGYCAEPHWNPKDSSKIVFTAAVNKSFQIALYDFKAKKSTFITNEQGDCIEPHWLNDGRHIIYTHRERDNHKLWLMDTLSGKKTQISPENFGNAMLASFSIKA